MFDHDGVAARADNTREFPDCRGLQVCGQVSDVMRRDNNIERAFIRGEGQSVSVDQPDRGAGQTFSGAFEQVRRKIDANDVVSRLAFTDRLQEVSWAAADLQQGERCATLYLRNGSADRASF